MTPTSESALRTGSASGSQVTPPSMVRSTMPLVTLELLNQSSDSPLPTAQPRPPAVIAMPSK